MGYTIQYLETENVLETIYEGQVSFDELRLSFEKMPNIPVSIR